MLYRRQNNGQNMQPRYVMCMRTSGKYKYIGSNFRRYKEIHSKDVRNHTTLKHTFALETQRDSDSDPCSNSSLSKGVFPEVNALPAGRALQGQRLDETRHGDRAQRSVKNGYARRARGYRARTALNTRSAIRSGTKEVILVRLGRRGGGTPVSLHLRWIDVWYLGRPRKEGEDCPSQVSGVKR